MLKAEGSNFVAGLQPPSIASHQIKDFDGGLKKLLPDVSYLLVHSASHLSPLTYQRVTKNSNSTFAALLCT